MVGRVTSFPAAARRARDSGLSLPERLYALRECVLRFCPYGFRATWHHLVSSAGIPQRLEDDPAAIDRAVAELEEAREPLLAHRAAYAERRRREKARGRRVPHEPSLTRFAGEVVAYCPDPERHPGERLVVVVRRVLEAPRRDQLCPACGQERAVTEICPACGVADRRAPTSEARTSHRWRQLWQRTAYLDRTNAQPVDSL